MAPFAALPSTRPGILDSPYIHGLLLAAVAYRSFGANASSSALDWTTVALRSIASQRLRRLFGDLVALYLLRGFLRAARNLLRALFIDSRNSASSLLDWVSSFIGFVAMAAPGSGPRLAKELRTIEAGMELELKATLPANDRQRTLPPKGLDSEEVLSKMKALGLGERSRWESGLVSGAVYHGGTEMIDLQTEAMRLFAVTNPLHADLWPSVTKFEAEVCAMAASLMNGGDEQVCGAMTSGGTESIIMAVKAHREWAREHKRTWIAPEIIAGETAHAALDKACEMLGIKLIVSPVDPITRKMIVSEVAKRITSDTIMIYSSAPSFMHGIIDPVEELSRLAVKAGCGLHVDCCLGGFFLPFANKLGGEYALQEKFHFGNPGVTSMSMDTHKYGYAQKGTSVVLFRSKELRRYMYFAYPKWPGGLYVTPSTAGSRPGALISAAWASMMNMGENGYLEATKTIRDAVVVIERGVRSIPGLVVFGEPKAMIVGFGCNDGTDIYRVCELMTKTKKWSINSLQHPASAHICVTLPVAKNAEKFVEDLRLCMEQLRDERATGKPPGKAPMYGTASALPSGPVTMVLAMYTDVVLKA